MSPYNFLGSLLSGLLVLQGVAFIAFATHHDDPLETAFLSVVGAIFLLGGLDWRYRK